MSTQIKDAASSKKEDKLFVAGIHHSLRTDFPLIEILNAYVTKTGYHRLNKKKPKNVSVRIYPNNPEREKILDGVCCCLRSGTRGSNGQPKSSPCTLSLSLHSPQTPIMKHANHTESRWCNWDNTTEVGASLYAEDRLVWCLLLGTLSDYTWVLLHTWGANTKQTTHFCGPINKALLLKKLNLGLFQL